MRAAGSARQVAGSQAAASCSSRCPAVNRAPVRRTMVVKATVETAEQVIGLISCDTALPGSCNEDQAACPVGAPVASQQPVTGMPLLAL